VTWSYQQSTGKVAHDSATAGFGYSGHGAGLNDPAMEAEPDIGPIPAGRWTIGPPKTPPDHLGPLAMPLTPVGFDPHGRSAFFIHGDNAAGNRSASHGCIILGPAIRAQIYRSGDTDLLVEA
jgi:hypothetical protein